MRSLHYSYIDLHDARKLEDPTTETILDLLKFADPRVSRFIQANRPFGVLRLLAVIPASAEGASELSHAVREVTLEEVPIYDLSSLGHLMCVGVGRYAQNQLRPRCILEQDSHLSVSREHGVIYVQQGKLMYRDIGTFRKGSTNGTTVNGKNPFFNSVIDWQPGDYLGIGGMINKVWQLGNSEGNVFRLRFLPEGAFQSIEATKLLS